MICEREFELSDCTEFRQTLLARPPRLLRATFLLLVALAAAGLLWTAVTQADLVVRASGRVRPMISSIQRPGEAAEESEVSPLRGGRVSEVHVREGDRVQQGDLLFRLDSERLQNELAKQRQLIATADKELVQLDQTEATMQQRYQTAKAKAEAELAAGLEEVRSAKERRDSSIQLTEVDRRLADDELQRARKLAEGRVFTEAQIESAEARAQAAELKLEQARLPVDEGRVLVLRRALQLVELEHAVECAEVNARRELKKSAAEATRLELAQLEWELRQSELRAPSDGTVTALDVRVGDVIEAGQPVLAIAELRGFRIDVAVTSEDVGQLREGLPARIKLDAYDYQKYGCVAGRVVFVSPDSEFQRSAPTQRPPTYTVRIALEGEDVGRGSQRGPIKLGMTGVADIVTDRETLLSLLVRSLRNTISLG